jgi:hypothetical protein
MAQQPHLDPKYTDGIYYDQMNGDFCEIQRGVNSNGDRLVELVNPETKTVYHDMPVGKWVEAARTDFRPVSDKAVEDPVTVVNRAIRMIGRNDIGELAGIPEQEAIDLRYAREQVQVLGPDHSRNP